MATVSQAMWRSKGCALPLGQGCVLWGVNTAPGGAVLGFRDVVAGAYTWPCALPVCDARPGGGPGPSPAVGGLALPSLAAVLLPDPFSPPPPCWR